MSLMFILGSSLTLVLIALVGAAATKFAP